MEKPKKSYAYKPQFAVVVLCDSETHQKETFDKLKEHGFKLKIVCV